MTDFSRQILLCLLCLSLLFSCSISNEKKSAVAINQNKKETIAALNNSVFGISVAVKGKNIQGKYSVGTGFLIGENLIASALHVQTRAEDLAKKIGDVPYKVVGWKKFASGEFLEFPIEIVNSDKENDLIIYCFDNQIFRKNPKFAVLKPLALAENLPPLGEEVVSIGYYGDYQFPFNSMGNVAMIDKNEDIFSDLTLMPGNSGAPVCDLETGEVLGITTDVLEVGGETVRYGIAKRAAKLRELLQKL